jgi:hypothetical protein
MNSRRIRLVIPAVLALSLVIASFAVAASQDGGKRKGWDNPKSQAWWKQERNQFKAFLTGREEVPATRSRGTGRLSLTVNPDGTMSFELAYSGLANPATAAHVHFGQPGANGGVAFFLCGGGSKPACPAGTTTPANVTGSIAASDVLAIPAQLLAAGDLAGIAEEMRAGFTYANIHTSVSPGGEIRGQVHGRFDKGFWREFEKRFSREFGKDFWRDKDD